MTLLTSHVKDWEFRILLKYWKMKQLPYIQIQKSNAMGAHLLLIILPIFDANSSPFVSSIYHSWICCGILSLCYQYCQIILNGKRLCFHTIYLFYYSHDVESNVLNLSSFVWKKLLNCWSNLDWMCLQIMEQH